MKPTIFGGPMAVQRPEQELLAACSVHGRKPFNEATIRMLAATESGESVIEDDRSI